MTIQHHFDSKNLTIEIKFKKLNALKITKSSVSISYFSGKKGGQNVNRHLNGVRIQYLIPESHRHPHKKTQFMSAKCVQQRSLDQNLQKAFAKLSHKIEKYFYTPPKRKATRVPKYTKEKRLKDKKINKLKKSLRRSVDY